MNDRDELLAFFERCSDQMMADVLDEGFRPPVDGEDFNSWLAAARQFALDRPSAVVDSAASVIESVSALLDDLNSITLDTPDHQHAALRVVIDDARLLGVRELLHQMVKDGELDAMAQRRLLAESGRERFTKLNMSRSWWHGHASDLFDQMTASGGVKREAIYSEIADRIEAMAVARGRSFKGALKDPASAVKKALQRRAS